MGVKTDMKAVRVALAIGIAILLPLLAQMTVRIYAEPPVYTEDRYVATPKTPEERSKANEEQRKREDVYKQKEASFNLQNFYVSFPLGILEIILGVLLRKRPTLGAGVMFGGLSTVACGKLRVLGNPTRLGSLRQPSLRARSSCRPGSVGRQTRPSWRS